MQYTKHFMETRHDVKDIIYVCTRTDLRRNSPLRKHVILHDLLLAAIPFAFWLGSYNDAYEKPDTAESHSLRGLSLNRRGMRCSHHIEGYLLVVTPTQNYNLMASNMPSTRFHRGHCLLAMHLSHWDFFCCFPLLSLTVPWPMESASIPSGSQVLQMPRNGTLAESQALPNLQARGCGSLLVRPCRLLSVEAIGHKPHKVVYAGVG